MKVIQSAMTITEKGVMWHGHVHTGEDGHVGLMRRMDRLHEERDRGKTEHNMTHTIQPQI